MAIPAPDGSLSNGSSLYSQETATADTLPSLIHAAVPSNVVRRSLPSDLTDAGSSSYNYLYSLTSHSLSDLRQQPAALDTSLNSLDNQLSALCSRHVGAFVHVHKASSSLPDNLAKLDSTLDKLIDYSLPQLSEASQSFYTLSQPHLESKKRAQTLLEQYELTLADVLDLPALLSTCVRANHPVEALQLGCHLARIASTKGDTENITLEAPGKAHGHTVLIALRNEAWKQLVHLRDDLLKGLDGRGLRLPAARRHVFLLRKFRELDELASISISSSIPPQKKSLPRLALSDSTLCLSLLRSRYATLVSRLEGITTSHDSDNPAGKASERIGIWRESVSDTLGLTLALFVDTPSKSETPSAHENILFSPGQRELSPTALVSTFATKVLRLLSLILAQDLRDVSLHILQTKQTKAPTDFMTAYSYAASDVLSTLSSLHMQVSYASASLARYGLDFSTAFTVGAGTNTISLSKVFEVEALWVWKTSLKQAKNAFDRKWTTGVSDISSQLRSPSALLEMQLSTIMLGKRFTPDDANSVIAQVPAVASLANGILLAYSALQNFCPLDLHIQVMTSLDDLFDEVVKNALDSAKSEETKTPVHDRSWKLPPLQNLPDNLQDVDTDDAEKTRFDPIRGKEADLALRARLIAILCREVLPFLVDELNALFEKNDEGLLEGQNDVRDEALDWAIRTNALWVAGERRRSAELEERCARRARDKEQAEKEDAERRAKEEAEERQRREHEERMRREDEERRRRAEEELKRVEAEDAMRRRVEQEKRRAKEEEDELKRREGEERRQKEEDQNRKVEEERRQKEKEEENQRRQAEEEEQRRGEEERVGWEKRQEQEKKQRQEEQTKNQRIQEAVKWNNRADDGRQDGEGRDEEEVEQGRKTRENEELGISTMTEDPRRQPGIEQGREQVKESEEPGTTPANARIEKEGKALSSGQSSDPSSLEDQSKLPSKRTNLAEKLKQRQEEREKAAKAKVEGESSSLTTEKGEEILSASEARAASEEVELSSQAHVTERNKSEETAGKKEDEGDKDRESYDEQEEQSDQEEADDKESLESSSADAAARKKAKKRRNKKNRASRQESIS